MLRVLATRDLKPILSTLFHKKRHGKLKKVLDQQLWSPEEETVSVPSLGSFLLPGPGAWYRLSFSTKSLFIEGKMGVAEV